MSLADGELEGEAKLRAEKLVSESDEARRALEGFRAPAPHVALWLSESLDRRATAAGVDGIADSVMRAIATEAPAPAAVVRIEDARARASAARPRAPRAGMLLGAVLGATAIAAGVALFIKSNAKPASDQMPVASVGMPSVDMQKPPTEPSGSTGVEVDEVDSPSRGISVFEIPLTPVAGAMANVGAARSGSSVVVWIDEEGEK
jgi:hypothetical protein